MPIIILPTDKQNQSEFARLLQGQDAKAILEEGSVVNGTVLQITHDFVIVDIGYKSEGQIPIYEFKTPKGEITIAVGDKIDVMLENVEDDHGMIRLSKERADALKAWDQLVKIQEEGGIVEGVILAKVKGGLFVDVGVKAFLPGSQVDVRPTRNLDKYVGKKFRFKIIKLNKKRGNIVLSRKEAMAGEHGESREAALHQFKEGQTIEGMVKNITEYGAFVDLGGIDGLLHVTDMSWGRVGHPSDLFKVGDNIKVLVLKVDEKTQRISLGYKQLQADPWKEVEGKFPVGSRIKGKVVTLADYGAFIELAPGVEGLVHISEISWNKKLKHPSVELTVGEAVEAIVLDSNPENRRIALGMKQLRPNPWDTLESQCPVGSRVSGKVRNVTDFGVFLDTGVGVDGLIHISDLDWVQNFSNPQEVFKKGDSLEAVVSNIDREGERFSLSRKQILPNPWDTLRANHAKGTAVEGKVSAILSSGVVVELSDGAFGFVPGKEILAEAKAGETLALEVIVTDEENRKFHLKRKS